MIHPLRHRLQLIVSALCGLPAVLGCGDSGVSPREEPPVWASLDAGTAVTCGVAADGRGYCWGEEWAAGRGGTREAFNAAPRELPLQTWAAIEAGHSVVCGLTRDRETYCWGFGPAAADTVPARVPADPSFASISVGDAHACGLTPEGVAYCWGDDFRGQTGTGQSQWTVRVATQVVGDLRFRALRAGPESTCAIDMNGDVFCWGGSEVVGEAVVPRMVQEGLGLTTLEYGGNIGGRGLVCGQNGSGTLYCFGYEPHENLPQPTPVAVALPAEATARQFAIGGVWTPLIGLPYSYQRHACAVGTTGVVACWGTNAYGQIGDSSTTDRDAPTPVISLGDIAQVTAGGAHSCALSTDGVADCWGANHRGQLGIGRVGDPRHAPRRVAAPQP